MSKLSVSDKTYDDEIDLLNLIQIIWNGKWIILSIVSVFLLLVFGFNIFKPNTNFTATTNIKPITSFHFDKYSLFNSSLKVIQEKEKEKDNIKIFEITQESLLSSYVEVIEERALLETGIDKLNFINKDDFESERDYKQAIEKFASEIKVLKPIKEKKKIRLYHVLSAEYNDIHKWKNLLTFVNNEANRKVKSTIINRFATVVSIQNQKRKFAIKDIDVKIDNVKKDYVRNTKDRLAFLTEQAAIARKLDIQKNTIASHWISTQNAFVSNVKTDAPFYLRGYLAIEEEIKQINSRKDKNAFTKDLFKLEQLKRKLEQEQTTQRAVELFNKSPLNQNDFKAALVKVATTDFKINNRYHLYYGLAIVLGSIIGVAYVLISNAFKIRRTPSANS